MERRLQVVAGFLEGGRASAVSSAPSSPEQVFLRVWELEAEVNNGGFTQYFSNASGRNATAAPDALWTIGAKATARLVDEALKVVGGNLPWGDDLKRQSAIDHLSDQAVARLEALDGRFWAYPDDLTAKLYSYVVAPPSSFPAANLEHASATLAPEAPACASC